MSSGWLGPLGPSARTSAALARALEGLGSAVAGFRFVPLTLVAAVLPLLGAWWILPGPWHQWIGAFVLAPVFMGLIAARRAAAAVICLAVAYLAHSAVAIAIASVDADSAHLLMPGGRDYWNKNVVWIRTGVDFEYDPRVWVPGQLQLMAAIVSFSYVSCGVVTLYEGFYQVDLMNYYNGQMLAHSANPWLSLYLGWHVWSLARGAAYCILTYEVTAWSLARLTGRAEWHPPGSRRRWLYASVLLVLDVLFKLTLSDPVQQILYTNLTV